MSTIPARVTLDRDQEPWLGTWTGLGEVRVSADGTYELTTDPAAPEPVDQVEEALRHGWAEPLSHARRGHWAAHGPTLAAPDAAAAVLVTGDGHDTAIVLLGLVAAGWRVVADRPAPLEFATDHVIAHPSARPVVVGRRRARRAGLEGPLVRADSDVVRLDELARTTTPTPLRAVVAVRRQRPHDPVLAPARGHAAIELLGHVLLGGALCPQPGDEPAAALSRRLRLARCPSAHLALDSASPDTAVGRLIDWWSTL